jgi:hypothetical protein
LRQARRYIVESEWTRCDQGRGGRDWLDQQWFIRLKRRCYFHAVARAPLFQDDGISAKLCADLRHGVSHISRLE